MVILGLMDVREKSCAFSTRTSHGTKPKKAALGCRSQHLTLSLSMDRLWSWRRKRKSCAWCQHQHCPTHLTLSFSFERFWSWCSRIEISCVQLSVSPLVRTPDVFFSWTDLKLGTTVNYDSCSRLFASPLVHTSDVVLFPEEIL